MTDLLRYRPGLDLGPCDEGRHVAHEGFFDGGVELGLRRLKEGGVLALLALPAFAGQTDR